MGSQSDWQTMRKASEILEELLIPHEIRKLYLLIAPLSGWQNMLTQPEPEV